MACQAGLSPGKHFGVSGVPLTCLLLGLSDVAKLETSSETPSRAGVSSSVARRYATGFYKYIEEHHGDADAIAQVSRLTQAIHQSAELTRFLHDKRIRVSDAVKAAEMLARSLKLGDAVRRLIGVVAQNHRLPILPDILDAIEALDRVHRGEITVEVRTATRLTDAQRSALQTRLIEAGYGRLAMIEHVDPALIGGLVVKIGPKLFDSSISGRLTRLQFAMKGAA